MIGFTIAYLDNLLEKYGKLFPRRSKLKAFDEVDVRAAALSNLVIGYHRDSGFLGHIVKKKDDKKDLEIHCSELDRILLIFKDGLYKVIKAEEKLFVGGELVWMGKVENNLVFNLIYRNGAENLSYAKRFSMPKFILNREYHLFEQHKRSIIQQLRIGKENVFFRASLVPSARARFNSIEVAMDEMLIKSPVAKGKRVSNRVVRRVSDITDKPRPPKQETAVLPGLEKTGQENGGAISPDGDEPVE
jgi:topoisomerase-4 subunit A